MIHLSFKAIEVAGKKGLAVSADNRIIPLPLAMEKSGQYTIVAMQGEYGGTLQHIVAASGGWNVDDEMKKTVISELRKISRKRLQAEGLSLELLKEK